MKKLKPKQKKLLIAAVAVVTAAAVGAGIFFGVRGAGRDPVGVYSFLNIGMTEYWGDSQESYGPVTTDRIQTIFLSDTQTVTGVKVQEGQAVKKGDVLFTYDTSLTDLQLERKRLEGEKYKVQLEDAQKELDKIKQMKPMQEYTLELDPDDVLPEREGMVLSEPYRISNQHNYDGSAPEKALICWMKGSTTVNNGLLEAVRRQAARLQGENADYPPEAVDPYPEYGLSFESGDYRILLLSDTEQGEGGDYDAGYRDGYDSGYSDGYDFGYDNGYGAGYDDGYNNGLGDSNIPPAEPTVPEETPGEEIPEETEIPEEPDDGGDIGSTYDFYVVFKITEDDLSLGNRLVWQGAHVFCTDGGFVMKFFNANGLMDYTLVSETQEPADLPMPDMGSGMTALQIKQLRLEQEKKIKDLELQQKMAEADYKIMLAEMGDGNVYADFDGEVVSLLDAEEAKDTKQPMMKVSGGGGYYIKVSVSELEKDNLKLGQEVTVNDWNTGMNYTGTVDSIGDFPDSRNGWNGMDNPNASYFPFTVFVDGDADLQEGNYVNVQYSAASSTHGIYLQNPFIRTENGVSYVLVRGENGKLERRDVVLGKALWGSYTEIRSGDVTEEDYLAFPYGKGVKAGAPAVEGDLADLYSY